MSKSTIAICLLIMSGLLAAQRANASTSATVSIGGSEQQIGGSWDTGEITISFNSFSETVSYGQFSSAASVASAFAGMFSRDYATNGLCAHAVGAVITFQLQGTATFGPITVNDSNTSFSVNTSGWGFGSGPPAPPAPPSLNSCQIGMLDPGFKPQTVLAEVFFPPGVEQNQSDRGPGLSQWPQRFTIPNEVLPSFSTGQ